MRNRIKLKRLRIKALKASDKRVVLLKEAYAKERAEEDIKTMWLHAQILQLQTQLQTAVGDRDATIARQEQQLATMRAALDV